jgi:hypothetical protein
MIVFHRFPAGVGPESDSRVDVDVDELDAPTKGRRMDVTIGIP